MLHSNRLTIPINKMAHQVNEAVEKRFFLNTHIHCLN
jgi:hypothetical protein